MPMLYKEGLYWIVLLAVAAAMYGFLAVFVGPIRAQAAFGLFGVAGLQPLLYRKRGQAVLCDERDTQIAHRAVLAGYSVFWLAFTLGVMGLWATLFCQGQSMISIDILPLLVMGGFVIFATARAVAIVVQYRLQYATKGE